MPIDYEEAKTTSVVIREDSRVTAAFLWSAGILGTLIAMGLGWIALSVTDLRRDVAVLLSRPEAVPRTQYERELATIDSRLDRLEMLERNSRAYPGGK